MTNGDFIRSMTDEDITENFTRGILSAESITLFAFENSWIHHCQNNSIGVCELIGWEVEE